MQKFFDPNYRISNYQLYFFSVFQMLNKLVDVVSADSPRCVMSLTACRSGQIASASSSNAAVASASPSQEDENIMAGNVSSDDDDDDPASAVANM